MFFKKKRTALPDTRTAGSTSKGSQPGAPRVSVRESAKADKPVRRSFPGPRGAQARLRVAVDRSAYAELIAHAKESLEAEVCGVLVGQICEDDEGPFVQVEAVIRGAAATQGSTHVTFTQATWNAIHETMERDHPKRRMVGWYHTHPGFGVEFSDMDLFIQRNFFSSPTQIALVTDPLSGAVAICANAESGPEYLPRFWVDGREQPCRVPERELREQSQHTGRPARDQSGPAGSDLQASVDSLEARVSQLVQVVDEQRASFHRFLMFCGIVVCLGVALAVGYLVYSQLTSRTEPPQLTQYIPVPIQVGDKTVLVGLAVANWQVPPELNSVYLQLEQLKRQAEEKAAKEAAQKAASPDKSTNPPAKPAKP